MFRQSLVVILVLAAVPAEARYSFPDSPVQQARPQAKRHVQQPKQTEEDTPGEGSAAALVGAAETAAIYRVRAMAGRGQYRQKVICAPSDVTIGANSNKPTNVENLVVFTGGVCPYGHDRSRSD